MQAWTSGSPWWSKARRACHHGAIYTQITHLDYRVLSTRDALWSAHPLTLTIAASGMHTALAIIAAALDGTSTWLGSAVVFQAVMMVLH